MSTVDSNYIMVNVPDNETNLTPLTTEEAAQAWEKGLKLSQPNIFGAMWRWLLRGW